MTLIDKNMSEINSIVLWSSNIGYFGVTEGHIEETTVSVKP